MVAAKKVLCQTVDCTKKALFNEKGQLKRLFCEDCKKPNMINMTEENARIRQENIQKKIEKRLAHEKWVEECKQKKKEKASREPSKKISCKTVNCTGNACYNEKGEMKRMYCENCKTPTMINVSMESKKREQENKRKKLEKLLAQKEEAIKKEQELKKMVPEKKISDMTASDNKISKKKKTSASNKRKCPCGNRASFNFPGYGKRLHCEQCKKEGMIDVHLENKQIEERNKILKMARKEAKEEQLKKSSPATSVGSGGSITKGAAKEQEVEPQQRKRTAAETEEQDENESKKKIKIENE